MSKTPSKLFKGMFVIVLILFVIFLIMLSIAGCGLVPEKQATDPQGNPYWIDASTNTATIERFDPETGREREPLKVTDTKVAQEKAQSLIQTVSGFVPPPYDVPVYIILGLGNVALGWFLKRQNKKTMESYGINVDLIDSIENNPEAKKAIIEHNEHSATTKSMVLAVTEHQVVPGMPKPATLDKAKAKIKQAPTKSET